MFLITRPFQLVVYVVWPGESESAVQNNKILQPKEEIEKNIVDNQSETKNIISRLLIIFLGPPGQMLPWTVKQIPRRRVFGHNS